MRVLPACSMAITFMVVSLPLVSSSSLLQERLAWKTALGSGREGREGRGGREGEREEGEEGEGGEGGEEGEGRGGLERGQRDGRGGKRKHK